jgi:hypothetical protein
MLCGLPTKIRVLGQILKPSMSVIRWPDAWYVRDSPIKTLQKDTRPVLSEQLRKKLKITNHLVRMVELESTGTIEEAFTLKFFVSSSLSHCSAADRRKLPRHPENA